MVKAFGLAAVIVAEDPKETVVLLMVTDELLRLLFPMLDKVFAAPLIDLLVKVCVPVKVATVESIAMVTADEPL